jgi:hypothetical protein
MLFAVFCPSKTPVLNDRSSHIWACWKGFALERTFRTSFGHCGFFEAKFNIKCTPIGTKKLYFQTFDEKIETFKKFVALIANRHWPLPMKILRV